MEVRPLTFCRVGQRFLKDFQRCLFLWAAFHIRVSWFFEWYHLLKLIVDSRSSMCLHLMFYLIVSFDWWSFNDHLLWDRLCHRSWLDLFSWAFRACNYDRFHLLILIQRAYSSLVSFQNWFWKSGLWVFKGS